MVAKLILRSIMATLTLKVTLIMCWGLLLCLSLSSILGVSFMAMQDHKRQDLHNLFLPDMTLTSCLSLHVLRTWIRLSICVGFAWTESKKKSCYQQYQWLDGRFCPSMEFHISRRCKTLRQTNAIKNTCISS